MANKTKSTEKKIGYRLKKNPLKTKDKVPYLADVVPVGTANLDTILSDVARELNITKAVRRRFGLRRRSLCGDPSGQGRVDGAKTTGGF